MFGRVRRAVEVQRAETAASAADVRAVRIAIAGEVARAYVDLRGSQERLRIARENADNQRQTLALIDARVGAGRGSELERAATDSARAAQLAHARFTAGAIDYYEVLDAERTLLQAQDAAADGRLRSADATVALYKALAGGWPSGAGRDAPIARR